VKGAELQLQGKDSVLLLEGCLQTPTNSLRISADEHFENDDSSLSLVASEDLRLLFLSAANLEHLTQALSSLLKIQREQMRNIKDFSLIKQIGAGS